MESIRILRLVPWLPSTFQPACAHSFWKHSTIRRSTSNSRSDLGELLLLGSRHYSIQFFVNYFWASEVWKLINRKHSRALALCTTHPVCRHRQQRQKGKKLKREKKKNKTVRSMPAIPLKLVQWQAKTSTKKGPRAHMCAFGLRKTS